MCDIYIYITCMWTIFLGNKCGVTGPMGHFVTFIYIIGHLPGTVSSTLYALFIHCFIHFKKAFVEGFP